MRDHRQRLQDSTYLPTGVMVAIVLLAGPNWQRSCAEEVRLLSPGPYTVIQREGYCPTNGHANHPDGPQLGFADVKVRFDCHALPSDAVWEYRVQCLPNAFGESQNWQSLAVERTAGAWTAVARVAAGGWYRLEIRSSAEGGACSIGKVEPIGVGEVFVVAGQSYAAGENDALLEISDPQKRVVCFDWQRRAWQVANDPFPNVGDGGTIWPAAGDFLLPILRVPVGFVNVAASGTSSQQWLPGTPLFERLSAVGREVEHFRFVLWQQGESDVLERTSTEQYVKNLTQIHTELRRLWKTDAPWLLAKSTLHPTVYNEPQQEAAIRSAIDELCQIPGFRLGPDTDVLGGENRGDHQSRRHFTELGQKRAGSMWFAAIWNALQSREKR